ncbi:MAG: hypothetical protein HRU26_15975 [Psychroserpens sp.]|nr:hypothetical protein [Psychroserpens sp.]
MADEIKIPLDPFTDTGLTLLAKVYNSTGSQEGSTVAMSEDGPALYIGDFDVTIRSDGQYIVRFETNSPDKLYGTGSLYIRDGKEVSPEMYFNQALDTVANVTLVATTTTNTDMRGTDGANTVAPDNAGISSNGLAIAALNNVSASDVYAEFTSGSNEDVFKADLSSLETKAQADIRQVSLTSQHGQTQAYIAALPTPLTAAQVNAEVDTALSDYGSPTKTEMNAAFTEIKGAGWTNETLKDIRDSEIGGASLSDIENSTVLAKQSTSNSILAQTTDIIADTNELQTNQGNWLTATGFATPANVTSAQSAIISEVDANKTKIDALETKAQADIRQTALVSQHSTTQSNISSLPQDKTGYSLTTSEHDAIATAIETALLNESDGRAIIDAIVQAIGNINIDQSVLVAAIVAAMDLENNIHTALDSYANKEDYHDDFEETAGTLAQEIVDIYNNTNP